MEELGAELNWGAWCEISKNLKRKTLVTRIKYKFEAKVTFNEYHKFIHILACFIIILDVDNNENIL